MIDLGSDRLGAAADDFYEALLEAHKGLSFPESAALNARLVLLLANHIGDLAILKAALAAASRLEVQEEKRSPEQKAACDKRLHLSEAGLHQKDRAASRTHRVTS